MTDGLFPIVLPVDDPDGLAEQEQAYGALAESVRRLIDLTVRTQIPAEDAHDVAWEVDELTRRLAAEAQEGPLGLQAASDGRLRDHGNPAVGLRNPLAPPLRIEKHPDHSASCTVVLGAAHEGPPGHVHGGIIALVLDQVLGTVPALAGKPGLTAYLTLTYRRPTPLGTITAQAHIAETTGRKTLVRGDLRDAHGAVTVEAEGLFITPTFALDALAQPQSDAGDFDPPAGPENP